MDTRARASLPRTLAVVADEHTVPRAAQDGFGDVEEVSLRGKTQRQRVRRWNAQPPASLGG